jgi:hypothetical protein
MHYIVRAELIDGIGKSLDRGLDRALAKFGFVRKLSFGPWNKLPTGTYYGYSELRTLQFATRMADVLSPLGHTRFTVVHIKKRAGNHVTLPELKQFALLFSRAPLPVIEPLYAGLRRSTANDHVNCGDLLIACNVDCVPWPLGTSPEHEEKTYYSIVEMTSVHEGNVTATHGDPARYLTPLHEL